MKHGLSGTRINQIHRAMKRRCLNPNCYEYKDYGGRGITICDEWMEFKPFYEWAMKNGYSDNLTIDRIDNNGNYEPNNCRWADWYMQANNTRTNRFLTYNGKTQTVAEWARELNISPKTLENRVTQGWGDEKALTYKHDHKKNSPINKKVDQYTLDGQFIKTHISIASASREIGVAASRISNVCMRKYRHKSAGGYIFRYHNDGL